MDTGGVLHTWGAAAKDLRRSWIAIKDLHLSINVKLLKVNILNYELNIIFRMDPVEGFVFFKIKFMFSLRLCAKNPSMASELLAKSF